MGGLGGNPYRDGSFEYYISEKVVTNDFKGVGSFILASIEIEAAVGAKHSQIAFDRTAQSGAGCAHPPLSEGVCGNASPLLGLGAEVSMTLGVSARGPTIGVIMDNVTGESRSSLWPGMADTIQAQGGNLLCFTGGYSARSPQL